MIAIMGKNAMVEVARVLRLSFLNDFATGALVAVKKKICAETVSSISDIEIGRNGRN